MMYPNDCAQFINSCTGDACDQDDRRIKVIIKNNLKGFILIMGLRRKRIFKRKWFSGFL